MRRNPVAPRRNEKQIEFLMQVDVPEVLYGGAAGGGKALSTDTPILTTNGWKWMGTIQVGDHVFDHNGVPVEVVAVSGIMYDRPCWLMTFDDGSEIIADGEHKWLTYNNSELSSLTRRTEDYQAKRRSNRESKAGGNKSERFTTVITERNRTRVRKITPPTGSIRTTSEIASTLKHKGRSNHAIPTLSNGLELPERQLPIDPYVLGLWLGDGTTDNSGFTTADDEVIDNILAAGWPVWKRPGKGRYDWVIGTNHRRLRSNGREGVVNDFAALLRGLGVIGNKYVPEEYLLGSRQQRLALLQGLMDSDGTVSKDSGSVSFVSTNQHLAQAVVELACSLGHKANLNPDTSKIDGKIVGVEWNVRWTPPEIVFRLSRKANRQKLSVRRTTKFRYITKCERIESVPVQCIQVASEDGMFLAGPTMIPTHNSEALLMAALQYVEVPGYAAIVFRRTYADLALPGALMDRAHDVLGGTAAKWNGQEKVWTFPSGATLSFGYLNEENDRFRYQSSEFQYIGFDELTQFKERDYRYLFSRLRRTVDNKVPLRMRSGTNPGGIGHLWVKKRFDPEGQRSPVPGRMFISALLEDNPYIDVDTYEKSLGELDSQTRKQLRKGVWDDFGGNHYWPNTWPRYRDMGDAYRVRDGDRWRHYRKADCSRLLALDWAMGKPKKGAVPQEVDGHMSMTGDRTAFVVADLTEDGYLMLLDCINERIPLGSNAPRLAEVCRRWQPLVVAGDDDNLSEAMLLETRRYRDIPMTRPMSIGGRNKLVRSQAAIVRAERGMVLLPDVVPQGYNGGDSWVDVLSDQLASFTGVDGAQDDIADAVSILGRLADEFVPGEDALESDPMLGATGYDGDIYRGMADNAGSW